METYVLQIINITFEYNEVHFGGTLDLSGTEANVVVEDSRFYSNEGDSHSADIYLRQIKHLRIANSIFLTKYDLNMPSINFEGFPVSLCDIQLWNTSFELEGFSPVMSNDTNFLGKARSLNIIELFMNQELVKIAESCYASGEYLYHVLLSPTSTSKDCIWLQFLIMLIMW